MKEFKGTPGEWSVPNNIKTLVKNEYGRSVCTTGNWQDSTKPFETDLENEANANLIATSPALLESLIDSTELMAYIVSSLPDGKVKDTILNTIKVNNSIINKALNQQ